MTTQPPTDLIVHVHGPCDTSLRAALALAGLHCLADDPAGSVWSRATTTIPASTAAPTDPAAPLLLTIPEAARRLGISRSTAYRLIAAGTMPVVHVGRAARVPADSLDEVIGALQAAPGEPTTVTRPVVASTPAADRWCDHPEPATYVQEQLPA